MCEYYPTCGNLSLLHLDPHIEVKGDLLTLSFESLVLGWLSKIKSRLAGRLV